MPQQDNRKNQGRRNNPRSNRPAELKLPQFNIRITCFKGWVLAKMKAYMAPGDRPLPQINAGDTMVCFREPIPGTKEEDEMWLKVSDAFRYLRDLKVGAANTISHRLTANELHVLRGGNVINSWPTDKKLKKTELWVLEIAAAHGAEGATLAVMAGEAPNVKDNGGPPSENSDKKGKDDQKEAEEVTGDPIEA